MRRLLLLRHAKAAQSGPSDIERPLAEQGMADATHLGDLLADGGYLPERILCSPALRTRQTLLGILPGIISLLPATASIEFCPPIYTGGESGVLGLLASQPDTLSSLLVIGHNPTMHALALGLTSPASLLRGAVAAKFPTTALAVIDFPTDSWATIADVPGALVAFLEPRGR